MNETWTCGDTFLASAVAQRYGFFQDGQWLQTSVPIWASTRARARRVPRRSLVLILDFWHAADHLTQLAKLLHAEDEQARQTLVTSWCHTMKHEGGERIVHAERRCRKSMLRL